MNKDDYVYCTKCKHFNVVEDETPYCEYQDECDIYDCEDSRRYSERPMYEEV